MEKIKPFRFLALRAFGIRGCGYPGTSAASEVGSRPDSPQPRVSLAGGTTCRSPALFARTGCKTDSRHARASEKGGEKRFEVINGTEKDFQRAISKEPAPGWLRTLSPKIGSPTLKLNWSCRGFPCGETLLFFFFFWSNPELPMEQSNFLSHFFSYTLLLC